MKVQFRFRARISTSPSDIILDSFVSYDLRASSEVKRDCPLTQVVYILTIRPWFHRRLSLCALGILTHPVVLAGWCAATRTFIERNTGGVLPFKLPGLRRASFAAALRLLSKSLSLGGPLSSIISYSPNLKIRIFDMKSFCCRTCLPRQLYSTRLLPGDVSSCPLLGCDWFSIKPKGHQSVISRNTDMLEWGR